MFKYRATIAGGVGANTTIVRPTMSEAAAYFARVWGDKNVLSIERVSEGLSDRLS